MAICSGSGCAGDQGYGPRNNIDTFPRLPGDDFGYYEFRETTPNLGAVANTITQIMVQDPSRWAFVVASLSSISISTLPQWPATSRPWQVPNNGVLLLSSTAFGPLVGVPWFAASTAINTTITVIEIFLRRQPKMPAAPQAPAVTVAKPNELEQLVCWPRSMTLYG